MNQLLDDAAQRAIRYLEGLGERNVAPPPQALDRLAGFDTALPEGPQSAAETLRQLDELGSPATMAMAGGRFFGLVVGGALPVTVASNWLATAWDQNTGLHAPSPATSTIERIALRWLLELLGLPRECRRRLRHRCDDGQLHRARRRAPCGARARRLARRGRRAVRRAADHRRHRR